MGIIQKTCFSCSSFGFEGIGLRRNSLRVNAISQKWEPTKVVPQADRVLIRLEELPEKSAGGVLLPKSAVKFERYLMGEVGSVEFKLSIVRFYILEYDITLMLNQKNVYIFL
nr:10 kDa chaperonin 1, chloroplastic [Ipomoea batatas]